MIFSRFPHIIQTETKDCGPTWLHLLCRYHGVYLDIQYLREICGMRKDGISVTNFIMAAERIGFKASAFRVSYRKFRSDIPLPCIVHWFDNHFIIVYKITKKYIHVSDPIKGILKYSFKDFAKGWLHHTHTDIKYRKGICIVCEPMNLEINDEFRHNKRNPKFISYILGYINFYKKQILQIATLSIAITFLMALVPLITQSVIDTGITSSDYNFIFIMIICCFILSLSSSLGNWLNQYINANTTKRIKMSMMTFFINKLLKLPVSFFSNRLMGDIIQRSRDYERIEIFTSLCFSSIALSITQFIVFSIILYFYNATALYIFILFSCAYIIWILFFWSIRKNMDLYIFSYIAKEQSLWIETLSNICDIKNFNYHIGIRRKWENIQSKLFKTQLKFINIENIQNIGSNLINTLRDLSLIFFCTINVIDGDMTFGMLVAIQFILGQLSIPIQTIVSIIINWQTAKISFKRIAEILTMKDEDINQKSIYWHNKNGGIKINDLFFSYNINNSPIISICLHDDALTGF